MLIPNILRESKTITCTHLKNASWKTQVLSESGRRPQAPYSVLAFKPPWPGALASELSLLSPFSPHLLHCTKTGNKGKVLKLKVITSCDQNCRRKLKTSKSLRVCLICRKEVTGQLHSYLSSDDDSCSTFIPSERLPLNLSSLTLLLLLRLRPPRDRDRLLRRDLLLRPLSLLEENREISYI